MNSDDADRSATAKEIEEWGEENDESHPVFEVPYRPERQPVDVSVSLHPQNHRLPDRGLQREPDFTVHSWPPVFVAENGETKHDTPLCPELRGRTHYMMCREEALNAYGENWCDICWRSRLDDDDSWTDPRYRGEQA